MLSHKIQVTQHPSSAYSYLEDFLASRKGRGLSQKTLTVYRNAIKRVFNVCSISDISVFQNSKIVDRIVADLQREGLSDTSVQSYVRIIKVFIYYLQEEDVVPSYHVTLPRAQTVIKDTYTDDELLRLTARPTSDLFSEYRMHALVSLILATGIRISSAISIQIQDVNLMRSSLTLQKTKQKKAQNIPLSTRAVSVLRRYITIRQAESPHDYLFCNAYGDKWELRRAEIALHDYAAKRCVKDPGYHKLRHTFAARYYENSGRDIVRLSRILGHASITTTEKYLRTIGADVDDLSREYDEYSPLDRLRRTKRIKK